MNSGLIRRLPLKALFLALLLALFLTGVAQAVIQNRKLSGDMVEDGDVYQFKISPDGKYIVFLADARTDGCYELFSVHTIGSERVLLSSGLSPFAGVVNFYISYDSRYVVYSVGSGGINPKQLFSVPISGGTPVELYEAESGDPYISNIRFSPDSSMVLFRDIIEDPHRESLLSVPIGGGETHTISASEDWCYVAYTITPDSQYVIYNQSEVGCDDQGLYQKDLTGGSQIILDDFVRQFKITPNGEYIIFTQETDDAESEIFSIPIGGGTKEKLNGTLPSSAKVFDNFVITPDSAYVIYMANEMVLGMKGLYRAPVDGSTTRLNLTPWGDGITSFKISPDSQWVVYRADFHEVDKFDLYSVPISGGLWNKLSEGMISEGDVIENRYEIAPNSTGVILIADYVTDNKNELYAVNMTGTWGVKLNGTLPLDGDVIDFRISHNSQGVVYRADQGVDEVYNLYLVPSVGGISPIRLNPDLVPGGDVGHPLYSYPFDITPDDKGVVYIADQEDDEVDELFITYDYQMIYLPMIVN